MVHQQIRKQMSSTLKGYNTNIMDRHQTRVHTVGGVIASSIFIQQYIDLIGYISWSLITDPKYLGISVFKCRTNQ